MKKHIVDTKYDGVIRMLTQVMSLFNTDHLRLLIEAKGLEERTDKRDYARVLRSAASRGLCRKTDIYKRSNIRGNNNIPRMMWCAPEEEAKAA
jgi:hypothetical protein|tara:strand:- start:260 stop:538 length:279 start_codon:yes stop_codon:yes gene_type:complete